MANSDYCEVDMTDIDKKREEIQLEIEDTLKVCGANPLTASALAYDLLLELSLKGVVIVVGDTSWDDINEVEPLIKEK